MMQVDDSVVRVDGGVGCYVISGSWYSGFGNWVYTEQQFQL